MNNSVEPNGWTKWSMYVLKELERLGKCHDDANQLLDDLDKRIDKLETNQIVTESKGKTRSKSSIWGLLGGGGLVAIIELIKFLIEKYGGR